MIKKRILIMGAAGRDFHNFNTVYRNNESYEVVAFTAAQIPNILNRKYPASLAGELYPSGIPIYDEKDLANLIVELKIDDVVFSYEATLHRYAILPEGFHGCLGRRMALVRPDQGKIIPRFLHYYFMSSGWRAVVEANIINGATVDRIPIKKFPDFEV